ncbi:MAG: tRNA (guanosine(37)-N1)-methyltransferase TrmD [Pseudomonadota bacterium]
MAASPSNRATLSTATGAHNPPAWRAQVITLVPDVWPGPLGASLAGQALEAGRWALQTIDLRAYGHGRHRAVDDTPAGGGPGMVIRADVVAAAIDSARALPQGPATGNSPHDSPLDEAPVGADHALPAVYLTPRGAPLTQARVRRFAAGPGLLVLAGRFEGVDERVIEARGLIEVSVGDYVLSGGDIAAMALLDACVRLLPGVMGDARSGDDESFEAGLLEYPLYTRPRDFEGRAIPEVLLSGDHRRIAAWRRAAAQTATKNRRPDLWARHSGERPDEDA